MANWFCSSAGWTAVTAWAASTVYSVGDLRRQLATPTYHNERVFRCTTAGTSGGTEPSWTLTKGGTTTDNTAVWTEVTGNSTYNTTSFAAPHATLLTAMSSSWASTNGDVVYVDTSHSETKTNNVDMSLACLSSTAGNNNPIKIITIASTFSNPPVDGDIITTAGGTAVVKTQGTGRILFGAGSFYCRGVKFTSGSGANAVNFFLANGGDGNHIFEDCSFTTGGTSGGTLYTYQSAPTRGGILEFKNCWFDFNSTSSAIAPYYGRQIFRGGKVVGTAVPTKLFIPPGAGVSTVEIYGMDLSVLGAGKYLCDGMASVAVPSQYLFNGCKLGASVTVLGTTAIAAASYGGHRIDLINCSDTTVYDREEHYQYTGNMVNVTTPYRVAGVGDGTTQKTWKVTTNANGKWALPFLCPDIFQWVDVTGSKTISLYIASGGTLNTDEAGMEYEFCGSATVPQTTYEDTAPSLLVTGSAITTDGGAAWTGTGAGTKQVVQVTKTIGAKGWIRVRPWVRKASATVYIDPLIVVT